MNDGLPQNAVRAIVQTRDGYLWVGTQSGLARFDGVRFTVLDATPVPELNGANILALLESRDGSLWVATGHGGVIRLRNGQFTHFGRAEGLADDNCLGLLYESRDGAIWIGTTSGLTRYQNERFTVFGRANGLSSNVVKAMCEDPAGNLWLATSAGIDCWKAETVIQRLAATDRLQRQDARTICFDRAGVLWVGSGDGLHRIEYGAMTTFSRKSAATYDIITRVFADRIGNLWVGTYGGLSRFVDGQFVPQLNSEGHPFDLVHAIYEDREGNVWVGSRDGLARLRPRSVTAFTQQEGLAHNNVVSVLEDRAGALWVGTWGGGLNQLRQGRVLAGTNPASGPVLVLGMCEDRAGRLWAGTDFDGGLFRFEGESMRHFGLADGLSGPAVRVLYEDRQGQLWVGTSDGLFQARGDHFACFSAEQGWGSVTVRVLGEDIHGDFWIGTGDGLRRRRDGATTTFTTKDGLSHNAVISLYDDRRGNLWIGTAGGGLNRWHDGRFTAYTSRQGLFHDIVCEILEDDHGWLWMSTPRGIFRVSRKNLDDLDAGKTRTLNSIAYSRGDGMWSELCNSIAKPAACKTRDGALWFATTKGLCRIDPNREIQPEESPPPVFIEQLIANKRSFPTNPVAKIEGPLRLPPGAREWEVRYTALSYKTPERNRFKYRLEGADQDWVDAGTRRSAFYSYLPPGDYRFRVIACNEAGVWNEAGATLAITLEPRPWETLWFCIAAPAAAFTLLCGSMLWILRRRHHSQIHHLEQQRSLERERTRIARDLHDELGVGLTEIGLLGDLASAPATPAGTNAEYLKEITGRARDLVGLLDEIVWAVNPANDTAQSLSDYFSQYAQALLHRAGIRCRLEVAERLPGGGLNAEQRHQLFLAFKEALNNVIRHAGATEVHIGLGGAPGGLVIRVADNGCGFDTPVGQGSRDGLAGMRERLRRLGGRCELQSARGSGTSVTFHLPIS